MTQQTPQANMQERSPDRDPVPSSPVPTGATAMQRMGLAVISMFFLVFLVNIMATLSSAFGSTGSAIGLVAVCLTVLGINVAFNLDVFRSRR